MSNSKMVMGDAPDSGSGSSSSKMKILLPILIVVIAIIGYFLMTSEKSVPPDLIKSIQNSAPKDDIAIKDETKQNESVQTQKQKEDTPPDSKAQEIKQSTSSENSKIKSKPTPLPNNTSDGGDLYVVQKGDCLWTIAEREMKNHNKWVVIFELNKDKISDPKLIFIGQSLKIK